MDFCLACYALLADGCTAFSERQVEEVGAQTAMAILSAPQEINVEKELELCEKHEIRILLTSDPEYPALLKTIPDAPMPEKMWVNTGISRLLKTVSAGIKSKRQYREMVHPHVNSAARIEANHAAPIFGRPRLISAVKTAAPSSTLMGMNHTVLIFSR